MKFKYEGFRQGGTTQKGEVEAGTKEQACEKLRLAGIYLQQIVPASETMTSVLPDAPELGTGPSEPAFLDTSLSAVDQSAVSDSAFVPAVAPIISPPIPTTSGFTGVPRETLSESVPEATVPVMSSWPEESQYKKENAPEAQETQMEPWQEEFRDKMQAFTMTMEELKKYVRDEELLKDVARKNLGDLVRQTWNELSPKAMPVEDVGKGCCVDKKRKKK